jgi:hypothetical protein
VTDTRACAWCGASLEGRRRDARFCGDACRHASWSSHKTPAQPDPVSEPTTDAVTAPNGFCEATDGFPWRRLRLFKRRQPAIRGTREQERVQ